MFNRNGSVLDLADCTEFRQTVAARPWREIETEDHTVKGWVQGDFLQLQPAQ